MNNEFLKSREAGQKVATIDKVGSQAYDPLFEIKDENGVNQKQAKVTELLDHYGKAINDLIDKVTTLQQPNI